MTTISPSCFWPVVIMIMSMMMVKMIEIATIMMVKMMMVICVPPLHPAFGQ